MRISLTLSAVFLISLSPDSACAEPLSAGQAVRIAQSQSPELMRQHIAARRAADIAADANRGSTPPPSVGLGAGVRRNALMGETAEVTLSVTQPVRLSSVAADRDRHARAIAEMASATSRSAELDVSLEVLTLWLELRHWERVVELRQSSAERARRLFEIVQARVSVGAAQAGDDALAESSLGRQHSQLEQARLEHERVHLELSLLLGAAPATVFTTQGELPHLASAEPAPHPAVTALGAQVRVRQTQAQLELSEGRQNASVGVNVTREGTGDWVMLGQVTIPLPLGNTASYSAAQITREVGAISFEAEHLGERLQRQIAALQRRLSARNSLVSQIAEREVTPAKRASAVLEHQFAAGKVPLQSLLLAREHVAEAELHLLDAQREADLVRVELAWSDGSLQRLVLGE